MYGAASLKMLETYTKKDFTKNAKNYNVNMGKGLRTLHKKGGCYYSYGLWQFIPFDTIEEVEHFEKIHNVNFLRCKNPQCGFKK